MKLTNYPIIMEWHEKYNLIRMKIGKNEQKYIHLLNKFHCRECHVFNEDKFKSLNERHLRCINCKLGNDVFEIHKEFLKINDHFARFKEEYAKVIFNTLKNEKLQLINLRTKKKLSWDSLFPCDESLLTSELINHLIILIEENGGIYRIK